MTDNKTYTYYGEILRGTPFENHTDPQSYLPYSEDFSLLSKSIHVGRGIYSPNTFCYQPMEGQDAIDGDVTEITRERYFALARGGAGLIWLEAVAVCPEGRSNPYQLMLTDSNKETFRELVAGIKANGLKATGHEPVVIMQMTHSGRYSKPNGTPEPIVAYKNPDLDKDGQVNIATDEYLSTLPALYAKSARLAEECGFDGVDLKTCHGYLLSELLSAYDREGLYGGDFEGRTRLLFECARAVNNALSDKAIRASRLNVYDGYEGKYCFGKSADSTQEYDLTEANKIISTLESLGFTLFNITMGSPYRNPDVSRPYRRGLDMPKTNAIMGLSRIMGACGQIKKAHPDSVFVNTGISALGALSPYAACGFVSENLCDFVGFGRMSFAYPALARDIISGEFSPKRACVACGGCSFLKKNVQKSGCIIRNPFYNRVYKDYKNQ